VTVRFPSKEWCDRMVQLANADPEASAAGEGWKGDFGAVVEPEPGKLDAPFAIHCVPKNGRIAELRVLADPDELEEIEPAYLARAPYSVWKGLIRGTLDPVEAVLRKRIQMTGDLQPILERMRYKGIADRVLGQLHTEFADEEPGR
jgi:putative sterol carrier protein